MSRPRVSKKREEFIDSGNYEKKIVIRPKVPKNLMKFVEYFRFCIDQN